MKASRFRWKASYRLKTQKISLLCVDSGRSGAVFGVVRIED